MILINFFMFDGFTHWVSPLRGELYGFLCAWQRYNALKWNNHFASLCLALHLENHTLHLAQLAVFRLNTLETTLEWAKTMTWKGLSHVVEVLETVYKKGVKIAKKAFQSFADRITRHPSLPKYGVTLKPKGG